MQILKVAWTFISNSKYFLGDLVLQGKTSSDFEVAKKYLLPSVQDSQFPQATDRVKIYERITCKRQ